MLTAKEPSDGLTEIDTGTEVKALVFTANGEYLVGGGYRGVRVWRMKDRTQIATMAVGSAVKCVAATKDGRYIAGGSWDGQVLIWYATAYSEYEYEQVFVHKVTSGWSIDDVDFSPDSTRLISCDGRNSVTIWRVPEHQQVQTLRHNWTVRTAKYSPQGDRIATATRESIQVWSSDDGELLVDISMRVKPWHGLLWFNDHLLVTAKDNAIKQIDAYTGLPVSKWAVSQSSYSSIALPQHGKFVAHTLPDTITFWDTSTHAQLGIIPRYHDIRSIAFSPEAPILAISAENGKIIITDVVFITEPEIHIDNAALDAWKAGQLRNAEALLTAAILMSQDAAHYVLASRALVRARLKLWDAGLVDAEEVLSVKSQRSVISYIAKCVALIGKGETDKGCRVCDVAFHHFRSEHVSLFLLIKAIALFMAGKHVDAISRMDDLISLVGYSSTPYVVQAYMYLLLGISHMEYGDYDDAIRSFEHAQAKLSKRTNLPPLIILLISGWKFDDLAITIQQRFCEALLAAGHAEEAHESVLHLVDQVTDMTEPAKMWVSNFKVRCCGKLEDLGDISMNARQYDGAISLYTAALSLHPRTPQNLMAKRSEARALKGRAGFKLFQTPDSDSQRSRRYVRPEQTKKAIRKMIKKAIDGSPPVLVNVTSGRLCDKTEQATTFESMPIFEELVSTMITHIDHAHIEREVREFYRYTTFSHTWEDNEPLFEKVTGIVVYNLEASPTHTKLQMFCKIAREAGFNWAWSDTCCIEKGNHFVLQEALVSMFKWYEGSAMTIIFLFDVARLAGPGALMTSVWNSRAWTLQEYHASKVVRIYSKDWTPYLGLTIDNHKDSPEIISEMEEATGISAQALVALRPGLDNIREKLRLASTRKTTRAEDSAYSLLGIFSVSLPITYGEGDRALGRLLAQLLTNSGDTSILAWTGMPGSFNSCLPADITVFRRLPTSHIPPAFVGAKMNEIIDGLRAAPLDLTSVTKLYNRLRELPVPLVVGRRVKLPCLAFKLGRVSTSRHGSGQVFRAQTSALGVVEIRTEEDISQFGALYLAHPWIDFLLDRHPVGTTTRMASEEDDASVTDGTSLRPPSTVPPGEKRLHILQFIVRLRQPFGALLLTPTRRNVEEYKRVAAESLITVQMKETTVERLEELTHGARMLDVL